MLPRIMVVFHSFGHCPTQFVVDIAKALRYSGTIIPAVLHEQSCYVDSARNKLVKKVLAEPDITHMMMIDVDLGFDSDAILKTFTIMQAAQAEIIWGNYPLGNGANSIFGPPDNASKEAAVRVNLKPNMVYDDIATGGTGWLMASTEVLRRMQKECPGPWHWFARDPTSDGTDLRGEDISFGLRAWGLNPRPKMVGTTAILLRHLKNQGYYASFMSDIAARTPGAGGICIPNPIEQDTNKYVIVNTSAIDKTNLSPEQLEALMKYVEAQNAGTAGTGTQEAGSQEAPGQEASGSVHLRNPAEDGVETLPGAGSN